MQNNIQDIISRYKCDALRGEMLEREVVVDGEVIKRLIPRITILEIGYEKEDGQLVNLNDIEFTDKSHLPIHKPQLFQEELTKDGKLLFSNDLIFHTIGHAIYP